MVMIWNYSQSIKLLPYPNRSSILFYSTYLLAIRLNHSQARELICLDNLYKDKAPQAPQVFSDRYLIYVHMITCRIRRSEFLKKKGGGLGNSGVGREALLGTGFDERENIYITRVIPSMSHCEMWLLYLYNK